MERHSLPDDEGRTAEESAKGSVNKAARIRSKDDPVCATTKA